MPERSNGYQLPSWPMTLIDRLLWNSTMADLDERLKAREALEASFESLQAQGIQASLNYIQVNVAPQLANLKTSIDLAQAQIDQIIIGGKAPDTLKFGGKEPSHYATAQALSDGLAGKVPNTRKVNGKELSGDIALGKSDVGLGNVDNTADADKPISSDQGAALERRIRVDAVQNLSEAEKGQARGNLGAGILAGHRNKIINGGFLIWQRGAGPFTGSQFTADRWRLEPAAGSSNSIQRADFIADDNLPFVDRFCLGWTRTVAGSGSSYLVHKIEGARTLAGKTCTLTVWARTTVATKLRASLQQRFGTGGTPSATENYNGVNEIVLPGGTGAQRFDVVFTLGKLSTKTFGTNVDDALWILFEWKNTDPNATIAISHVSLVEGDATKELDPFSERHPGDEFALCQRYYEIVGGTNVSTKSTYTMNYYKVVKRRTPTLSVTGGTLGGSDIDIGNNSVASFRCPGGTVGATLTDWYVAADAEL